MLSAKIDTATGTRGGASPRRRVGRSMLPSSFGLANINLKITKQLGSGNYDLKYSLAKKEGFLATKIVKNDVYLLGTTLAIYKADLDRLQERYKIVSAEMSEVFDPTTDRSLPSKEEIPERNEENEYSMDEEVKAFEKIEFMDKHDELFEERFKELSVAKFWDSEDRGLFLLMGSTEGAFCVFEVNEREVEFFGVLHTDYLTVIENIADTLIVTGSLDGTLALLDNEVRNRFAGVEVEWRRD